GSGFEPLVDLGEQPLRHAQVVAGGEHDGEVASGSESGPRPVGGLGCRLDGVEALRCAYGGADGRPLGDRHQPAADLLRYSRTNPSMSPSSTRWASPTSKLVRWSLTRWSG